MALTGKGFFVWKVPNCEGGDVYRIAQAAQSAGLTHVLIKIANGMADYNVGAGGTDYAASLAQALRGVGVQPWGWHYVYGANPAGEANMAIQRINQVGVDGYVINAETEYKEPGKKAAATRFMSLLRSSLPNLPMGLSSFRYPSYHPTLPWREFLEKVDYNMPQVYWMQAHNAGAQLTQSLRQFQGMTPFRPVFPTGAAFGEWGWKPTNADVKDFLQTAVSLNLSGANFWEWSATRGPSLPGMWDEIASFQWGESGKDIVIQYVEALNARDAARCAGLYTTTGIRVTQRKTIQGMAPITNWFQNFFHETLPNATFTLSGFSGTGSHRHFNWTATSTKGQVNNGNDTIGILNGKIAYHYSFFSLSS